jgi:hypothetical protein
LEIRIRILDSKYEPQNKKRFMVHVFLSLLDPDPDPVVRGMDPDPSLDPDPDPSIIKQI